MRSPMNNSLHYYQGNQLTEHIYAIIDSRIQYLEYRATKSYQSYSEKNESSASTLNKTRNTISHFEQMLTSISNLNKSLKLLTLLRTRLIEENARMILYLLTNNKYLSHTEEALKRMLKEKNFRQLLGA